VRSTIHAVLLYLLTYLLSIGTKRPGVISNGPIAAIVRYCTVRGTFWNQLHQMHTS